MYLKRVFKIKRFDRWAKKVVSDVLLCQAALKLSEGFLKLIFVVVFVKNAPPLRGRVKVDQRAPWLLKSIKMSFIF